MERQKKVLDKPIIIWYNCVVKAEKSYPFLTHRVWDIIQKEVLYMAKLSEKYEAIVVFSLKKGEEQIKALTEKFSDLIKANGTLTNVDEWGKRKLAYEINYEGEGWYVLYNFESKPDFPAELERVINITDGVLRSIVVLAQGK